MISIGFSFTVKKLQKFNSDLYKFPCCFFCAIIHQYYLLVPCHAMSSYLFSFSTVLIGWLTSRDRSIWAHSAHIVHTAFGLYVMTSVTIFPYRPGKQLVRHQYCMYNIYYENGMLICRLNKLILTQNKQRRDF